jgi:Zn-dependent protease with chaperone function
MNNTNMTKRERQADNFKANIGFFEKGTPLAFALRDIEREGGPNLSFMDALVGYCLI